MELGDHVAGLDDGLTDGPYDGLNEGVDVGLSVANSNSQLLHKTRSFDYSRSP